MSKFLATEALPIRPITDFPHPLPPPPPPANMENPERSSPLVNSPLKTKKDFHEFLRAYKNITYAR